MEKILSYIREWERRRIPGAENYMLYALFLLLTELLLDNPLWRDRVSGDIILFLILYGTMIFLLFAVFPPVFAVRRRGLQDRVRIYAFTGAAIFLAIRFLLSIFLRRNPPMTTVLQGFCRMCCWSGFGFFSGRLSGPMRSP